MQRKKLLHNLKKYAVLCSGHLRDTSPTSAAKPS